MAKVLKDLVLAMLNATLVLIAVCLFLAWRLSSSVDGMVATFAGNLEIVAPLRSDVQSLTGEVSALRADLNTLTSRTDSSGQPMTGAFQARIQGIDAALSKMAAKLDAVVLAPEPLIDHAIETTLTTASDRFARAVNDIRNCRPAGS